MREIANILFAERGERMATTIEKMGHQLCQSSIAEQSFTRNV